MSDGRDCTLRIVAQLMLNREVSIRMLKKKIKRAEKEGEHRKLEVLKKQLAGVERDQELDYKVLLVKLGQLPPETKII